MTTGRKLAVDIVILAYCAGVLWIAYEVIADPDTENRRLQRMNVRYRAYQSLAERFGRLGLQAEKEYLSAVEKMRTI